MNRTARWASSLFASIHAMTPQSGLVSLGQAAAGCESEPPLSVAWAETLAHTPNGTDLQLSRRRFGGVASANVGNTTDAAVSSWPPVAPPSVSAPADIRVASGVSPPDVGLVGELHVMLGDRPSVVGDERDGVGDAAAAAAGRAASA